MNLCHSAVLVILGAHRPTRGVAGALLGLSLVLAVAGLAMADGAVDTVIEVDATPFELTVDVCNAPLSQVLNAIAERAGVEITLYGDADGRVTQSFAGLPLEEGIRRLARGHSVTAAYGQSTADPTRPKLTAVWIAAGSPVRATTSPTSARPATSAASAVTDEPASARPTAATGAAETLSWTAEIHRLAREAQAGSDAAVAQLTDIGTADPEAGLRQQAVAALARLRTPAAEHALVAALSDVDAAVRLRAVRGLRTFGTSMAAESIAGALIGDADPQVRFTALAAVGSLSGPRMLAMLRTASADPNATVRETALRWIAWWTSRGHATP